MAKSFTMSSGASSDAIDYTGSYIITPSTENKTIPSNRRLVQDLTIFGSVNLKSENIVNGVNLFGVNGAFGSYDSSKGSKAYLKSENYNIEHNINYFSGNQIVETIISNEVSPEDWNTQIFTNVPTYFGKRIAYYYDYTNHMLYCYKKETGELISQIDLSQYSNLTSSNVIPLSPTNQSDKLCMLLYRTTATGESNSLVLVTVADAKIDKIDILGSYDLIKIYYSYSINEKYLLINFLSNTTSSYPTLNIFLYDIKENSVVLNKQINLTSDTIGNEDNAIPKIDNIKFDSADSYSSFKCFYIGYKYASSILITKFDITTGTQIASYTKNYPYYQIIGNVSATSVSNFFVDGNENLTVINTNSSESENWVSIWSENLSVGSNKIYQKKISTTVGGTKECCWDRYASKTIIIPMNISLVKIRATDGQQMFKTTNTFYPISVDRYARIYYSTYPSSLKVIDTSISITSTITTPTFTATIEEV